ncbi:Rpn family recombination-promoting nuclease/putative transposase [Candidatus Dependentiae bacterium]|nr:Rpn family recombination-promoting nuclease/putative transposase [Candidatus Dependentiae bacterium]
MIEFMDPKYDTAFKKLFGAENLKNVTIAFLNAILEYKGDACIESIRFLNNERQGLEIGGKKTILDVHCTDKKGRQFIIEMQNAYEAVFDSRLFLYAAKTYAEQFQEGARYTKIKPVIVLAITKGFTVFPKKKSYKSIHVMLDKDSYEHDFKGLTLALVELPKFNKTEKELKTNEDKWLFLLKEINHCHEVPAALRKAEFAEACQALNKMTWSAQEVAIYEKNMLKEQAIEATQEELDAAIKKAEKALTEGMAQGMAQGKTQAMQELAKKLLAEGMSVERVATLTGLSVEEIKWLCYCIERV